MAITTAFVNAVYNVFAINRAEPDGPTGADAVRGAVYESEGLASGNTATLGEPDITMNDGNFFDDPKVVVPIYDCPFDSAGRLVFDLPMNREDRQSLFFELLRTFGLEFETMEQLEGTVVPVEFMGGNAVIDWSELGDDEEDTENAAESDDADGDESGDESPVNVEETTLSGGDNNDG
jgi:hypothetical protein